MVSCCLSLGPAVFTLWFAFLALTLRPPGPWGGLSLLHTSPLTGLGLLPGPPARLVLLLLDGLQLGRGELLVGADAALTLLGVRLQQTCGYQRMRKVSKQSDNFTLPDTVRVFRGP